MHTKAYNPALRAPLAPKNEQLHWPFEAARAAGYEIRTSHIDDAIVVEPGVIDPDGSDQGEISLFHACPPLSEHCQAELAMILLATLGARAEARFGPQIEHDLEPGGANICADALGGMVALRAERLRSAGTPITEPVEAAAHRLMVGLDLLIRDWNGGPTPGAPIPAELALAWADLADRAGRYVEVEVTESRVFTVRLPFTDLDERVTDWWTAFGADADVIAESEIEDFAYEQTETVTPDEGETTYVLSLGSVQDATDR